MVGLRISVSLDRMREADTDPWSCHESINVRVVLTPLVGYD